MNVFDILAENVGKADFAKRYRRSKVKAIEELIGRPLAEHEKAGVRVLDLTQLRKIVKALSPGDPNKPEIPPETPGIPR